MHTENRALTAQINLYYDLYTPDETTPRPLLLALHGYGASKRQMMRDGRAMAPDGWAVAALQGFHQHIRYPPELGQPLKFGFGWLTNFKSEESVALHHKFVLDVIANLVEEGVADPKRLFLLGFSQTCALNFRFAFTHAEVLRGVVGLCGGLPGDWNTSEIYQLTDAAVLYLHGARDEFYPPARVAGFGAQLRSRARDVETRALDAAHDFTDEMRAAVREWLRLRAV
jgi:predicted esterase